MAFTENDAVTGGLARRLTRDQRSVLRTHYEWEFVGRTLIDPSGVMADRSATLDGVPDYVIAGELGLSVGAVCQVYAVLRERGLAQSKGSSFLGSMWRLPDGRTFELRWIPRSNSQSYEVLINGELRLGGGERMPTRPNTHTLTRDGVLLAESLDSLGNPEPAHDPTEPARHSAGVAGADGAARMSCAELARRYNVDPERLRKRLDRHRKRTFDGWIENVEAKSREARYLYQVSAVEPIVNELKATSSRPAKRPANVRRKNSSH